MGAGFYEMRERGLFWVLSRLYIEMEQYPLWDQEVVITAGPVLWSLSLLPGILKSTIFRATGVPWPPANG